MAKLKLNGLFLDQMSGRHGDAVVRSLRGRTFTSRPPTRPNTAPSEAQRFVQDRFKLANGYASSVLRDATKRGVYEQVAKRRGTSVFAQAMGDFLRSPEITLLDLDGYHGRIGDPIRVLATDDTGVTSVTIVIRSATNAVLEEGPATLLDQVWTYTGKTAMPVEQTVTIEATAKDRPGNAAGKQQPYNQL